MNYGHLELRIEELLQEKGISKNMICKELDIPRSNFNRYCRNELKSGFEENNEWQHGVV